MRNKAESKKSQSGQILLYTTIIVMLAALILVPLMNFTFSSHRSANIRTQRTLELYASDAGIEDALYQIKTEQKGTALASLGFGNTSSYNPGTPALNDRTENVTVQKVWLPQDLPANATIPNKPGNPAKNWTTPAPVNSDTTPSLDTDKSDKLVVVGMLQTVQATAAADDFDHNWPGGSSGGNWTGNWTSTGSASLASGGVSGSNCLGFAGAAGNAKRPTSLPDYMEPELKFQAKASSFGNSDTAICQVSTDGGNWTTVTTWADGNETTNYNSFDIDLYDQYGLGGGSATPLWLQFNANLHNSVVASDNFESNTWTGGSGWASQWTKSSGSGNPTGETAIIYGNDGNGPPQQGNYSLRLRSNTGYAQRQVNLSNYATPHLQFWAKAASFQSGQNAQLLLKVGSGSWTTLKAWTHGGSGNLTDDNTYHFFDIDLSQSGAGGQSSVWIAFQANMGSTTNCFYVDNINIVQGASFKVDNVWIGYQANSDDVEIAYTDPNFDPTVVNHGVNDPAYLDRIGVWMPPGCEYVGVVGNQTTSSLNQYLPQQPDILTATYAGGTILEWDFSSTVNLGQSWGNSTSLPIIWDLTFSYSMPPTQVVEGMFIWIKAHGPGSQTYLSWDQGYEIYKAVSKAHSQILGTNTQVAAYVGQGEVNKNGAASYGDYVAAGAALLFDNVGDGIKRQTVNPSDPYTWVIYPTPGGFLYDGRDQITTIPSDAKVTAAWLYWSAFMKTTDWVSHGSQPDTTVNFMYPKRYGPETFAVVAGNGNDTYTTAAWRSSGNESMDLLAHQPVLTLSQVRYVGEVLGNATAHNGNDTFWTAHQSIQSPAPTVRVGGVVESQSGNYTINYATGNVTIINDNLSGPVTIDYWASGSMTLRNGTDYAITQNVLGQDIRYTGFTVGNDTLQGNVTIDYYYAKHWQNVTHAAYDKYGTALPPVQTVVPLTSPVGDTYACFDDVTQLLTGNGTYTGVTGNGQYAVGNVTATVGGSDPNSDTRCFSGWSLIVLYESPTGTAHQFYLWDPIHNAAVCPFMVQPNTDSSIQPPCVYVPPYVQVPFTLNNFYPPAGTVTGKLTYFVGEGDVVYTGDSVGFKGASQTSYTFLSGPNNPVDNVMNCLSTNGQSGIDLDTYSVLGQVGNDTQANVLLRTQGDRWYLTYMILSFNTNVVPPPDYSFNVASITYQYQLGGK